jgi:transcriptional regulator with XRE-family HTH domain
MESIKQRRARFGMTQKELAAACGCHFSHICHIERGRTKPSLEVFVKMTEELKLSPKKLLELLKMHPGASVTDIQKARERRKRRRLVLNN